MRGAACAGASPDLWHPDRHAMSAEDYEAAVARAKAICATCPARAECLDLALSMGLDARGVMGATTLAERRRLVAIPAAQVARRAERAEVARTMRAEGLEIHAIAGQLGVDPKSVYRYLRPEPEEMAS